MEKISFVIPCYNSTNTISAVVDEIRTMIASDLKDYDYEIVLVNDCSPDGTTFNKIKELCAADKKLKGINLARNFGQPSAVMAGLHYVTGDYVVCGDDDGQTPYNQFPLLFTKIQEGYDIVEANFSKREKRSLFRKFGTWANETMAKTLIKKPNDLVLTSYWVIRKFVAKELLNYKNPYPYLGGLLMRVSRNACNVQVEHRKRLSGNSGYSFKKMILLWLNGFTNFSVAPLRMATIFGGVVAFAGFAFAIFTIIRKILDPTMLAGYASIISIMLFMFGFCFLFMGLIGEYVGRIFISLNNAPQFIVKESVNTDK